MCKIMKRYAAKAISSSLIVMALNFITFVAATSNANADILFSAKIMGPVSNITKINEAKQLTKITDNIRWRDMHAHRSHDGGIVFMSNREADTRIDLKKQSENFNIYILEPKSAMPSKITDDTNHELSPRFSPNGNWIAYMLDKGSSRELHIVDRQGKNNKKLATASLILDYSWSPDSLSLSYALVEENHSALVIIDINNSKARTLVEFSSELSAGSSVDDKRQIQIASPAWSPDGGKIAYIKHPLYRSATRQLMLYDIKTRQNRLISGEGVQVQEPVSWSQNSKKLLYAGLVGYKFYYDEKRHRKTYQGGMQIFLSHDGKTQQLTQGPHLYKNPIFSPDEKRIAYLYADKLDDRTVSLNTMKLDGTSLDVLYESVAKNSTLVWYEDPKKR